MAQTVAQILYHGRQCATLLPMKRSRSQNAPQKLGGAPHVANVCAAKIAPCIPAHLLKNFRPPVTSPQRKHYIIGTFIVKIN